MPRTRYQIFEKTYPYFMTSTVVAWLPVFVRPEFVEILFDSWRFLQQERDIRIFGYVVMENHIHWIASAKDSAEDLSEQVGRFKSYTARRIIDELDRRAFKTLLDELQFFKLRHKIDQKYQVWQEGSHPQQIQDDEMMQQKLEYMHQNPRRRGYVDDPIHWRYSSARNYAGMQGLLEVETDWR
ncbi:MAG: transposase [Planctomycetia bacterium]|nr:transposase [Planctomycetia bacterium]